MKELESPGPTNTFTYETSRLGSIEPGDKTGLRLSPHKSHSHHLARTVRKKPQE